MAAVICIGAGHSETCFFLDDLADLFNNVVFPNAKWPDVYEFVIKTFTIYQ